MALFRLENHAHFLSFFFHNNSKISIKIPYYWVGLGWVVKKFKKKTYKHMLQIKLINVYGSHSQLTLLASLINNSCYSQTAVQFIISKKNLWLLLIMIRDDWEIESLQWEYLRVKSLQKNHCWIDFLQNALLQKSLLQIETSFRKNPCRKKITA